MVVVDPQRRPSGQAGAARAAPHVRVEQTACIGAEGGGGWRTAWRITNLTASELRLVDARFPHGRFRSGLMALGDVTIAPRSSAGVEAVVECCGAPGDVVENAFLIATVEWRQDLWRILARMTVRFTADGAPEATTELVTVQRVGFSRPERQLPVAEV